MNMNTDNLCSPNGKARTAVSHRLIVQIPLFKPALEAAMAEQLAEIQRIANDPAPPDFENTIAALERAASHAEPRQHALWSLGSNDEQPDYQVVQREMAPRLAAFNDQITQNEALFKRIEAVYNSPAKAKIDAGTTAPRVALLHKLRSRGRALERGSQETSFADQSTARWSVHQVQPERARRRNGSVHRSEE